MYTRLFVCPRPSLSECRTPPGDQRDNYYNMRSVTDRTLRCWGHCAVIGSDSDKCGRSSSVEFIRVRPSSSEFGRVRPNSPEFARVRPSSPEFARVRPSSPEFARVRPSLQLTHTTLRINASIRLRHTHTHESIRSSDTLLFFLWS